jgi:IMP dehydrogenase
MSIHNKIVETAITFDDVLLVPSYSEVLPNQVSLKSRLTDKISLNVPIVSAAMDTVTEADLALHWQELVVLDSFTKICQLQNRLHRSIV